MGFLKNIFKEIVDNVVLTAESASQTVSQSVSQSSQPVRTERTANAGRNKASGEALLRKRLEAVFEQEYAGCQVIKEEKVFGESHLARPYSYVIMENGTVRLCINVLTNRNHGSRVDVRIAVDKANEQNVKCINFYTHLPNTEEYVSNRIKENMC